MTTRKLMVLGLLAAMFAAGCPTNTPTGTDPNITRPTVKRSPKPSVKPSNGTTTNPSTNPSTGASTNPSSSPSTGASSSPSPNPSASASVAPAADYWAEVKNSDGTVKVGAIVTGFPADATGVATQTGTATTDAKGQIQKIEAAGKALNLVATVTGDDTLKGYLANVTPTDSGKVITLAKVGNIKGTVTISGATGQSVENIKVFIPGTPFQATTNATGAFTIEGVPVGTFNVTAESATLGKANKSGVTVTAGADTTLVGTDLALSVSAPTLTTLAVTGAAATVQNAGSGVEVTLTGTNFGHTGTKPFKVTFGGAEAESPTRVSDTQIKAVIPATADSGDVIVSVNDLPSNAKAFQVLSNFVFTDQRNAMPQSATYTFKARAIDKKGALVTTPHIGKWEVSAGTAVTVSATGLVTAVSPGVATVKVSSGAAFETVDVTVNALGTLTVSSVAGGAQGTTLGTGAAAQFAGPIGIAMDGDGNLFVADQFQADNGSLIHSSIKKITPAGEVTKAYGQGGLGDDDGAAAVAKFRFPSGMVFDSQGNLFVCDQGNNLIRKIDTAGNVTTFAGDGSDASLDGNGTAAKIAEPAYICIDANDNLYLTEWGPTGGAGRIRKITPAGVVTTLAGGLNAFFDGVGTGGRFRQPMGITIDAAGQNLYVADFGNNAIRKVAIATQTVSTVSGPEAVNPADPDADQFSGASGFVDGPLGASLYKNPSGVAFGKDGKLYVCDDGNNAIRGITIATGAVTTLVGTGSEGSTDGNVAVASFKSPHDLVVHPDTGDIYVIDNRNFKIRKIVF